MKAYLIPDNYLPNGYKCLQVFIPDNDYYLQQFWAAYQFFTQWTAWERDDLRRGRLVAFKWREGFDLARAIYEQFGGCPMAITNIRQNPANECQMQYSMDGGVTWAVFADISKCQTAPISVGTGGVYNDIRIYGGSIQGQDSCGDWQDISSAPSDPRYNATQKALYDPSLPGQACIAAANAAMYLEDRLHGWATIRLNVVGFVQQIINIVQGLAAILPEASWSILIWEVYDEIAEWSEDWWTDIQVLAVYDPLRSLLAKYYAGDGSMTREKHIALVDEMKTHYDGPPTTTSEKAAWFILTFIVNGLGSVGMTRITKSAGITEADCSATEWEEVFELAASPGGWLGDNECQHITGVGFVDKIVNIAGINWRGVAIERTIPPTTLTYFRAEYECELGTTNQPDGNRGQLFFNGEENPTLIEQDDNAEGSVVLTWQGSQAGVTFLNATKNVSAQPAPADGGGGATMRRVVVRGIGDNPFR